MGFRVELEGGDSTEKLLRKLTSTPQRIFPTAFSGYILFLFTGDEKEIIKSLQNQLIALDALTGDTLAFAVFVDKFTMTVAGTDGGPELPQRTEFNVGALKTHGSLTSLVKAGRVGWVAKGMELVAVTYATNKVATELGVLSDLPCIVVLDGAPAKDFKLIKLTKTLMNNLVSILRTTIDRLRAHSNFHTYISGLKDIENLEQQNSVIDRKIQEILSSFTKIDSALRPTDEPDLADRIRPLLLTASSSAKIQRVFGEYFTTFRLPEYKHQGRGFIEKTIQSIQESHPRRRKLYSTITALAKFEEANWPLADIDRDRLDVVVSRHVEPDLLIHGRAPQSGEEVAALKMALETQLQVFVEACIKNISLPDLIKAYEREIDHRLSTLRAEMADKSSSIMDILLKLPTMEISFSEILLSEVGRSRVQSAIRSSSSGLSAFLRPWMRPQTLLSIARLAQHI
jgi:hypothetical protein